MPKGLGAASACAIGCCVATLPHRSERAFYYTANLLAKHQNHDRCTQPQNLDILTEKAKGPKQPVMSSLPMCCISGDHSTPSTWSVFIATFFSLLQFKVTPTSESHAAKSFTMSRKTLKSRVGGYLIAIIGDEDTATGFLLAGVGENHITNGSNYFVVDPSTSIYHRVSSTTHAFFQSLFIS